MIVSASCRISKTRVYIISVLVTRKSTNVAHSQALAKEERKKILQDSLKLLRRDDGASLRVAPSTIPNAGLGVYTERFIERHTPICLYPGMYTPPFPTVQLSSRDEDVYYLAKMSHKNLEDNAYILNLRDVGGYIDGSIVHNLTVSGPVEDNSEQKETSSNSVLMVEDNGAFSESSFLFFVSNSKY